MKINKIKRAVAIILVAASIFSFTACSSQNSASVSSTASAAASLSQSTVYGKVTAVSGSKITLSIGALKTGTASSSNNAPQGTPPSGGQGNGTGTASSSNNAPQGTPPSGGQGNGTGTASGSSNAPQGTPPSGGQSGTSDMLTLTGETKTVTISDTGILTKQSTQASGSQTNTAGTASNSSASSASLSDITMGSILKLTYNSDTLVSVMIMVGTGGQSGSISATGTPSITGTGAYTKTGTASNQTVSATNSNQSGVKISNGGTLVLSNSTITKSGKTTSDDESNFYGLNAGVVAQNKSSVTLKNSTITTSGEGANAAFAYGSGSSVTLDNVTINTSADSSRGLDATYGGTVTGNNVKVTTKGTHCAGLATDRGEGTVNVTNSTINTAGTDSPAIYSTGSISASASTLTATGSEALVIEGKNSITLTNCTASGSSKNGVMMYQSFSGDAATGTSKLSITGGSLTTKAGALFFITNTNAEITLNHTTLSGIGTLINASATSRWGTSGSNGGTVKLTANSQTLKGDVVADKISSVTMVLNQSTLTGTLNKAKTAKVMSLTLDASSTWNVTGTSYLTALSDSDSTLKNIKDNGNTIYYDSTNSTNSWLNGKTIQLSGGGKLTPMSK